MLPVALTLIVGAAACVEPDMTVHAAVQPRVVIVSYRDAVARAAPSVVTVHSAYASKTPLALGSAAGTRGQASGVIIDHDGYIVTNYHVVQDASQLAVAVPDGSVHATHIIGVDPESDIALLKIDADGLQAIEFADVEDVAPGDVVLALGNPLGVGQTVTQGIVSAVVRKSFQPIENFIQTDAAINPGNSGGALIDTAGRLVGINTLILSHSGGSEGIGFAIPVDYVQMITAILKAKGQVSRAWLGVSTGAPAKDLHGALVLAVEREGPAARAGIAPGDIVVRMADKNVERPQDLRGVVIGADPGSRVEIELVRNGRHMTVQAELGPLPTAATRR